MAIDYGDEEVKMKVKVNDDGLKAISQWVERKLISCPGI